MTARHLKTLCNVWITVDTGSSTSRLCSKHRTRARFLLQRQVLYLRDVDATICMCSKPKGQCRWISSETRCQLKGHCELSENASKPCQSCSQRRQTSEMQHRVLKTTSPVSAPCPGCSVRGGEAGPEAHGSKGIRPNDELRRCHCCTRRASRFEASP